MLETTAAALSLDPALLDMAWTLAVALLLLFGGAYFVSGQSMEAGIVLLVIGLTVFVVLAFFFQGILKFGSFFEITSHPDVEGYCDEQRDHRCGDDQWRGIRCKAIEIHRAIRE